MTDSPRLALNGHLATSRIHNSMIYFIRCPRRLVKIGTCRDLGKRIKQLTPEFVGANDGPLEVLGVIDGGRPEEATHHKQFAHLRVSRELFRPDGDLLDYIAANSAPWRGLPEAPRSRVAAGQRIDFLLDQTSLADLRRAAEAEKITVGAFFRRNLQPIVVARLRALGESSTQGN